MMKAWLIALAFAASPASAACHAPDTGTDTTPILSPPLGAHVIGTGRLQFYSAPQADCAMTGVFVIPNDALIAYAETRDGWTSVMYLRKQGDDGSGWVRSSRLNFTGTMGPQ
jgi:hypothetical protein